MCSHDKWTIWLSHCGSVKVRVCKGCGEAEWLNVNATNGEGEQDPTWETMLDQTVSDESINLASPPPDEDIPF